MLKVERVEGVDGGVRHLTDRMMDKINRYLIEFKAEIYASSMNGHQRTSRDVQGVEASALQTRPSKVNVDLCGQCRWADANAVCQPITVTLRSTCCSTWIVSRNMAGVKWVCSTSRL